MKILVAGGLSPEFEEGNAEEVCARALGRAIASAGHVPLNGAYNTFDRLVAEAANEVAQHSSAFGGDATAAIHTYLSPGWKPKHKLGKVQKLNVSSWDPGQPQWGLPEPLLECDALVVMRRTRDPPGSPLNSLGRQAHPSDRGLRRRCR